MRALTHPVTVAFGLANLYLLSITEPLVSPGHDLVYHLTGSASAIFIPVIIYVVALWLLLAGLLAFAERRRYLQMLVWPGAVLALPWILIQTFMGFMGDVVPGWVSLLVGMASILAFIAIAARWRSLQAGFDAIQPFVATILGFFALSGVIILTQLIWFGWQARDLNPRPLLHKEHVADGTPRQRIVWIVLDELSYQQVYERRFPGLQLPAFDRLAAESTVFTHVVPAGQYTRQIIPSLFTGIPSDRVRISGAGLLVALHDTVSGRWDPFQPRDTVFQDAIDAGYSTGIAGWYNPYCRIMPSVLDRCAWIYREETPARFSPKKSIAANLVLPFHLFLLDVKHLFTGEAGLPTDEQLYLKMRSSDYASLLEIGDALLRDQTVDFVVVHMPVPHPQGFYDRESSSVSSRYSSYIDNLALADQCLGHVRALLEQQGQWGSSTVVVMGDHSWRTRLIWANSPGWTAEDSAASHGGQFDARPAYIVKLPDQQAPAQITTRFSAIHTRALFGALLKNELHTPDDLRRWVLFNER